MTDSIAHIRAMTQNAMNRWLEATKTGDRRKIDEAEKDYTSLCVAIAAMERQIEKVPTSRKGGKLVFYCPSCHHYIGDLDRLPHEYCEFCGQKLRQDNKILLDTLVGVEV